MSNRPRSPFPAQVNESNGSLPSPHKEADDMMFFHRQSLHLSQFLVDAHSPEKKSSNTQSQKIQSTQLPSQLQSSNHKSTSQQMNASARLNSRDSVNSLKSDKSTDKLAVRNIPVRRPTTKSNEQSIRKVSGLKEALQAIVNAVSRPSIRSQPHESIDSNLKFQIKTDNNDDSQQGGDNNSDKNSFVDTILSASSQYTIMSSEIGGDPENQVDRRCGLRVVACAGSVGAGKSENFSKQRKVPAFNNNSNSKRKQGANSSEKKLPKYKLQGENVAKETFFAFRSITPKHSPFSTRSNVSTAPQSSKHPGSHPHSLHSSPSALSLSVNNGSSMIALSRRDHECGRELTRLAHEGLVNAEVVDEMENLKQPILKVDAKLVTVHHGTAGIQSRKHNSHSVSPKNKQLKSKDNSAAAIIVTNSKEKRARAYTTTTVTTMKQPARKDKQHAKQSPQQPKSLFEAKRRSVTAQQKERSSSNGAKPQQTNAVSQPSRNSPQPIKSKQITENTRSTSDVSQSKKPFSYEPARKRVVIAATIEENSEQLTIEEQKAFEKEVSPAENILENYLLGMKAIDKQLKREEEKKQGEIVFNNWYLKVLTCSAQIKKPIEIEDTSFIALTLYPLAYAAYFFSLQTRSLPLFLELILESGDVEVFVGRSENPNWDQNDFFACQFEYPMKINYSRGENKGDRVYISIFSKKHSRFAFRITSEASSSPIASHRNYMVQQNTQAAAGSVGGATVGATTMTLNGSQTRQVDNIKRNKQTGTAQQPAVDFNKQYREKLSKEKAMQKENYLLQMKQIEARIVYKPTKKPSPADGVPVLKKPPTPTPRQPSPKEQAEIVEKQRKEQQVRVIRAAYNSKKVQMESMNKTILRIQRKEDDECRNPNRLEREIRLLKSCFQTRWLQVFSLLQLVKVLCLKIKAHKVKIARTLHATGPIAKVNTYMMAYMKRRLGTTVTARTLTRTRLCLLPRMATMREGIEAQASILVAEVLIQEGKIIQLHKKMMEFYNQIIHIQKTHRVVMAERAEMMAMNRKNWDTAMQIICDDEKKFNEKSWITKCAISDLRRRIDRGKETAIVSHIKGIQTQQVEKLRAYRTKLSRISRVHQIAYVFCSRILHNYFMKQYMRTVQETYSTVTSLPKKTLAYYIESFKVMIKLNAYPLPHKNPITAYENEKNKLVAESSKKKTARGTIKEKNDELQVSVSPQKTPIIIKSPQLPTIVQQQSCQLNSEDTKSATAIGVQHNNTDQVSPPSSTSSLGSTHQLEELKLEVPIGSSIKHSLFSEHSQMNIDPLNPSVPVSFQEYLDEEEKQSHQQMQNQLNQLSSLPQIKVSRDPQELERQSRVFEAEQSLLEISENLEQNTDDANQNEPKEGLMTIASIARQAQEDEKSAKKVVVFNSNVSNASNASSSNKNSTAESFFRKGSTTGRASIFQPSAGKSQKKGRRKTLRRDYDEDDEINRNEDDYNQENDENNNGNPDDEDYDQGNQDSNSFKHLKNRRRSTHRGPHASRTQFSMAQSALDIAAKKSQKLSIFLSGEESKNSPDDNESKSIENNSALRFREKKRSIMQSIRRTNENQEEGTIHDERNSSSRNSSIHSYNGSTAPATTAASGAHANLSHRQNSISSSSSANQEASAKQAATAAVLKPKLPIKPKKKKLGKKAKFAKSDEGKLEEIVEGDETSQTFWANFIHYPIFAFCPTLTEMKEIIVKLQKKY